MLKNETIPSKERTQFLWMTLDNKLIWEEHIDKLRKKAKKALNTIKGVVRRKWGGDLKTIKSMAAKYTIQPSELHQ